MQKLVENATILGTTFYHTIATNGIHEPELLFTHRLKLGSSIPLGYLGM
jgi:hypothetical protein